MAADQTRLNMKYTLALNRKATVTKFKIYKDDGCNHLRYHINTRNTHQCRSILAQPAIQYVASLVLVHWNWNGISRARDLTTVFAIDHASVELHSDWLHTAKPGLCLLFTC